MSIRIQEPGQRVKVIYTVLFGKQVFRGSKCSILCLALFILINKYRDKGRQILNNADI